MHPRALFPKGPTGEVLIELQRSLVKVKMLSGVL